LLFSSLNSLRFNKLTARDIFVTLSLKIVTTLITSNNNYSKFFKNLKTIILIKKGMKASIMLSCLNNYKQLFLLEKFE